MGYPAELVDIDIVFTRPPGPGLPQGPRLDKLADEMASVDQDTNGTSPEEREVFARAFKAAMQIARDEACEFIEVELTTGRSIGIGRWLKRPDGHWVLRIEVNEAKIRRAT